MVWGLWCFEHMPKRVSWVLNVWSMVRGGPLRTWSDDVSEAVVHQFVLLMNFYDNGKNKGKKG